MRTRLNPWVVVLTAALTFGSLMAFVGPRSFGRHWGRYGYYDRQGFYGPHGRYDYGDCNGPQDNCRIESAPARPDTNAY